MPSAIKSCNLSALHQGSFVGEPWDPLPHDFGSICMDGTGLCQASNLVVPPVLLDRGDLHRVCGRMHRRLVMARSNFIGGYCRKMPAYASANIATRLPRRFKSEYRGDSKMDTGRDLFEGEWFLVPRCKAQALVSKEIAGVKAGPLK